ncbi:hypothetical protein HanIR_Chr14g0697171 [Helianthus annuus]|nr:hypothetical protein HanIR_Chr14g0697171 [Helianthus annuus]
MNGVYIFDFDVWATSFKIMELSCLRLRREAIVKCVHTYLKRYATIHTTLV